MINKESICGVGLVCTLCRENGIFKAFHLLFFLLRISKSLLRFFFLFWVVRETSIGTEVVVGVAEVPALQHQTLKSEESGDIVFFLSHHGCSTSSSSPPAAPPAPAFPPAAPPFAPP